MFAVIETEDRSILGIKLFETMLEAQIHAAKVVKENTVLQDEFVLPFLLANKRFFFDSYGVHIHECDKAG